MIINRYSIFYACDVASTVFILSKVLLATIIKLFSSLTRLLRWWDILLDLYTVNMILLLYNVTKALIGLIFIHL